MAHPEAGRRGRRDRDAALLLLLHPVHRGGAIVHFTDLVRLPRVVEDALRRRGLAGIDVRHDADVAVMLERCSTRHSEDLGVTRSRVRQRRSEELNQQKNGWTSLRPPAALTLARGSGIHPLSPGTLAAAARVGTLARRVPQASTLIEKNRIPEKPSAPKSTVCSVPGVNVMSVRMSYGWSAAV
jgi:hypothetical protein